MDHLTREDQSGTGCTRSGDRFVNTLRFISGTETNAEQCRGIWFGAILQASQDARMQSRKADKIKDQKAAQAWIEAGLTHDDSDFAEVCSLAGLELGFGRDLVRRLLDDSTPSVDFRCLRREPSG